MINNAVYNSFFIFLGARVKSCTIKETRIYIKILKKKSSNASKLGPFGLKNDMLS